MLSPKLLIITQKVDSADPVLGFMHGWIERMSSQWLQLQVICLQKGTCSLPSNVRVFSLGKEQRVSRLQYLVLFYKYICQLRHDYDFVFVHMNPIYVVLGQVLWRAWGRKIFLWYNHAHGDWLTAWAARAADRVFYTSPQAFTSRFKNSRQMPAGIDTELFRHDEAIQRQEGGILYLGRIAPIKRIEVLTEAAQTLSESGACFNLHIVGGYADKDRKYYGRVRSLSWELENGRKLFYRGPLPNFRAPEMYNQCQVLVNLSPAGLFDKTVFEAMACESLVLASSRSFAGILPEQFIFAEGSARDLADKLRAVLQHPTRFRPRRMSTRIEPTRHFLGENHGTAG